MARRTKLQREIEQLGWTTRVTSGGHLCCMHPMAKYPVFAARTPSDRRSWRNLVAELRRAVSAEYPSASCDSKPRSSALH